MGRYRCPTLATMFITTIFACSKLCSAICAASITRPGRSKAQQYTGMRVWQLETRFQNYEFCVYILADCEGRELRNKSQVNKSTEPRRLYYEDCATKIALRRSGEELRSFAQIEGTNEGAI